MMNLVEYIILRLRTFGLTPDQMESISSASRQLEMETKNAHNMGAESRYSNYSDCISCDSF